MQVQPYLFFDGRGEEAIEFYKKTLGAKVDMLMRWKDSPGQVDVSPGNENKVMHAALKIGDATCWPPTAATPASRISRASALTRRRQGRGRGRQIVRRAVMPAARCRCRWSKTSSRQRFGMVADKFGVGWMIIVEPK